MIISGEKALAVFKKVRQVQEEYRAYALVPQPLKLSIEDLYRVVAAMYGVTITKSQVPFEGTFLRGLMERYAASIIIRVRKNQDDDWKRFTSVKELCHVVIDETEDWSTAGVETINDLLVEYYLTEGDAARRVTQSEMFAEIAAIELMYPFEFREADISKLKTSDTTHVRIANQHGLPASMVGRALDAHYHINIASKFWAQLAPRAEAAAI